MRVILCKNDVEQISMKIDNCFLPFTIRFEPDEDEDDLAQLVLTRDPCFICNRDGPANGRFPHCCWQCGRPDPPVKTAEIIKND